MSDTPKGLMLAGCGAHRDDPNASCYKIRRLDGTALTVADVWAELTAAQAEIAELRATIRENIATIKTLSEKLGAASELPLGGGHDYTTPEAPMSKPHVWVVEEFYNGKWCINQTIDTGYLAALRGLKQWISCNDGAQFRVAKYVRVEPTAKRRKGK